MDIMVQAGEDPASWTLTDLLGRSMLVIVEAPPGVFMVKSEGQARATMAAMNAGPFGSLDLALAAIEKHTRGVCRRVSEDRTPETQGLEDQYGQR